MRNIFSEKILGALFLATFLLACNTEEVVDEFFDQLGDAINNGTCSSNEHSPTTLTYRAPSCSGSLNGVEYISNVKFTSTGGDHTGSLIITNQSADVQFTVVDVQGDEIEICDYEYNGSEICNFTLEADSLYYIIIEINGNESTDYTFTVSGW